MLQISNLKVSLTGGMEELRTRAAQALELPPAQLPQLTLVRQSVDARHKGQVHYVYTVRCALPDENKVLKNARGQVSLVRETPYVFPDVTRSAQALRPVVVGMGPAGLFAALFLARAGLPPILLERGRDVDARTADVEQFWRTGQLSPVSNVQFGEGGAGTFSDGKLNTGTRDIRIRAVLEEFVRHGAPEDILWQQHPHVGTDLLRQVVKSIRQELLALGCQVCFEHRVTGLRVKNGQVNALEVETPQGPCDPIPCDTVILAIGHSARDTFQMLLEAGAPMEPKAFAMGVRVEHSQKAVSEAQYGPQWGLLPPSTYKLACHLPDGRGVFSFCVCPGGQVVAAASGPEQVVTNGMSYRARDNQNINGGLLVGVSPADFEGTDPLAGVRFQQRWERAAWELGGRNFHAPAQDMRSFLAEDKATLRSPLSPTYRPGVREAELERCLPQAVTGALRGAIPILGRQLRGFDAPEALLTGVETRSSSPVRLLRDQGLQSPLRGLFPCGEGAGWAGGITSAAVDGIKVAEAVAAQRV